MNLRWDLFATYIRRNYPLKLYRRISDVGCGPMADSSLSLLRYGYEVTSMDPRIETKDEILNMKNQLKAIRPNYRIHEQQIEQLEISNQYFNYEEEDIDAYDVVIGLEPCEATEHIIRACLRAGKPFTISLCGAAHDAIDGTKFSSYKQWHQYLQNINPDETVLETVYIGGDGHILIRKK